MGLPYVAEEMVSMVAQPLTDRRRNDIIAKEAKY
jgi:hypothetical protein